MKAAVELERNLAIALLFPGQGAQAVGMGSALSERSELARELFSEASDVLGYDLKKLCDEGPSEELNRTEHCQPALFVHSLAALRQLELERPAIWEQVELVAGLSLGEYTAVAAAGGLSFADGLRLVKERGLAMQAAADATPSSMSSVIGLDEDKLSEVCEKASGDNGKVQLANLLCPGNIAISGDTPAVELAEKLSVEAGAMKAIRLAVAGAFHTEIMAPAVERLHQAISNTEFRQLTVPVVSNVDAKPHADVNDFKTLLPRQVVSPVLWEKSLRTMLEAGIESFIEIGCGRVLSGTLKRTSRKTPCECFGD